MTEIERCLETMEPELRNITRLFGLPDGGWEAPPRWRYEALEEDGRYRVRMTDGERTVTAEAPVPSEEDERLQALHRKRAVRRLVKQTLYALCRESTGIHPPWGSSTGVRPTHLYREALAMGLTPEEAEKRLTEVFDFLPEKAALTRETVTVQETLPPPSDGEADVYVGIPFCTTRCAYCSFASGELGDGHLVGPYLDALFREMRGTARLLEEAGKRLRAVYVGGGTPTALGEEDFAALLDELMDCFGGAREMTVEAGRPDTLTPGKLRRIREAGVGRISINPQTMNDRTLRVIGRAHTAAQVAEAYRMAREADIRHINMDVIAGLPGEGPEDFARTMEWALRLRPESLTVHTLAIKRNSRMHLEGMPLPTGDSTAVMVDMGRRTAASMGMLPYYLYRQKQMAGNQENVGYALPGHACLYNVDMMEETAHVLACGAGAISKRIFPEEGHIERAPNVSDIGTYLRRSEEMLRRKRALFLGGIDG